MKKPALTLIALLVISIVFMGCRTAKPDRTATLVINLSGTAGVPFTGYYLQAGRRVEVAGVLPWTLQTTGITEFEFRKVHVDDELTYAARYKSADGAAQARQTGELPAGLLGVRCQVIEYGLSAERF